MRTLPIAGRQATKAVDPSLDLEVEIALVVKPALDVLETVTDVVTMAVTRVVTIPVTRANLRLRLRLRIRIRLRLRSLT